MWHGDDDDDDSDDDLYLNIFKNKNEEKCG